MVIVNLDSLPAEVDSGSDWPGVVLQARLSGDPGRASSVLKGGWTRPLADAGALLGA